MGNCICKQEFHGPLLSGAVSVDAHVLPIWFSPVIPMKKLFPGPVPLSRSPGCCERAARCWPRHIRSAAGRGGCSWLAGLAAGDSVLPPAARAPQGLFLSFLTTPGASRLLENTWQAEPAARRLL